MSRPIRIVRAAAIIHFNSFRCRMYHWLLNPANVDLWRRFETEANKIWLAGKHHYSARTIGEYLRHETAARDGDSDFKVNDWVWPDLARLYMLMYPDRAGFFELRGRRAA